MASKAPKIPAGEKSFVKKFLDHAVSDIAAAWAIIDKWPVDGTKPPKPPQILTFVVEPTFLPEGGGDVHVSWTTQDATSVFLNEAPVALNGDTVQEVTLSTAATLVAKGVGDDAIKSIDINVMQTPQLGELLPIEGSANSSLQLNNGPADWINIATLPEPTPWTLPHLLAPSQNGQRVERWFGCGPFGVQMHLYEGVPELKNGRLIQNMGAAHHSDVVIHAQTMASDPPLVGPRGQGHVHPIATWHFHPTELFHDEMPIGHGIRADGAMIELFVLGELAGGSRIAGMVPVKAPLDFSYMGDGRTFLTADSERGSIVLTDRGKALARMKKFGGREVGELWTHRTIVSGRGKITGVRWTPFGIFWCANGRLEKLNNDGTVTQLTQGLGGAFGLDYTSTGKLAVLTTMTDVYIYDPATDTFGENLTPSERRATLAFGTICVDKNGTCGPKDSVYYTRSQGQQNGNETFCYYTASPPYVAGFSAGPFSDLHVDNNRNGGWLVVGDMGFTFEHLHYGWAEEIHPFYALALTQGTGNLYPRFLRPQLPTDPVYTPYNNEEFNLGREVHKAGCALQENVTTVPSLACQMNVSCWSVIGISADYLANLIGEPKAYQNLATWISRGGFGSFPRPDITGYYMRALGRFYLESSQRYLIEGAPLVDGWHAWCDVNSPGPVVSFANAPKLPAGPWMVANREGTTIKVYLQDKDLGQKVIPANAVIDIIEDQGMPSERIVGTVSAPDWLLTSYEVRPGPHAWTCRSSLPAMYTKAVQV